MKETVKCGILGEKGDFCPAGSFLLIENLKNDTISYRICETN